MTSSLEILSDVIGWMYTVAWSVSFYPQVWLNHTRKSVTGLSFEYQAYNITGFLFYSTYCLSNYIVQHDSSLGLVQSVEVNDLVFVFHAVLITCFIIWQCYAYKLKSHNLNKIHLGLVCVFWILFIYNMVLFAAGILPFVNKTTSYQYTVCEYLGYVKVSISFIKYCPQAYMNWSRQSTVGWAVGNVLLDLTGGLLALAQQSLEAYRQGNTSEFTSNVAKLMLSLESIAFDLLFIVQHYLLYGKNNAAVEAAAAHLTRAEQEALEVETQAKAKASAAALLGVAGILSAGEETGPQAYQSISGGHHGSLKGARGSLLEGDEEDGLSPPSTSAAAIRGSVNGRRDHDGGGDSGQGQSILERSLGNGAAAQQMDLRTLSQVGSPARRGAGDEQRTHLLPYHERERAAGEF